MTTNGTQCRILTAIDHDGEMPGVCVISERDKAFTRGFLERFGRSKGMAKDGPPAYARRQNRAQKLLKVRRRRKSPSARAGGLTNRITLALPAREISSDAVAPV